ncbi:MAG: hypothetical protein HPZ91_15785 [Lentisphaeria bacterium]|nr:hypothetical protein [Lentisphaeria bacterium]
MKKMLTVVAAFFAAASAAVAAEEALQLKSVQLEPSGVEHQVFEGTVQYGRTVQVSFEAEGRLVYVIPAGTYVRSELLNEKGLTVTPGDLLAQQDTEVARTNVSIAESQLKRAAEVLKQAEHKYERNRKLHSENAVSTKDFQESETQLNIARLDHRKAELDLLKTRHVLDACSIRAPFSGLVEEVYGSKGASMDVGDPVLKVSMIDPVKVVMKIPDDAKLPLSRITRAMVTGPNSDVPVPGWFSGDTPVAGQLECYVENPLLRDDTVSPAGSPLPVVDRLSIVRKLPGHGSAVPLWIDEFSLKADKDGSFVWRIKEGNIEKKPQTPSAFFLEKIRVEPLDLQMQYGIDLLRAVKDGSKLRRSDVLAGVVPENLREDELAAYRRKQYLFRIGDKVKVKFSLGDGDNIFRVTEQALHANPAGGFSVWLDEKGKAKEIPVSVLTRTDGMARIYSPALQEGMRLLLPPPGRELKNGTPVATAH